MKFLYIKYLILNYLDGFIKLSLSDKLNLMLGLLTAITTILTYFLMKAAVDANKINKSTIAEQFRLGNFPLINLRTSYNHDSEDLCLIIQNVGSKPVFDLDIWIIVSPLNDGATASYYFENFVKDEQKSHIDIEFINSEQTWYISDRGLYPNLIIGASINAPLNYPSIHIAFFDVLIQYRDILGNNYYQRYLFDKRNYIDGPYVATEIEPEIPKLITRFDLTESKSLSKECDEGIKHLHLCQKASFYSDRLITGTNIGPEVKWRIVYS